MKILSFLILLFFLSGCENSDRSSDAAAPPVRDTLAIEFMDVTQEAGIDFVHDNGAFGKKYMPETTGAGCGFFDYDNDGRQDILLINSVDWPGNAQERRQSLALYRNLGDGRFREVAQEVGLVASVYGMGMAAADYDNDGDTDLLLTAVGPNQFFRNDGGKFTEIGEQAGLADPAWSTSAMFFDYDKDGLLDLYVCNYVQWTEDTDLWCTLDGKTKAYCTPEIYTGVPSKLFHNKGDGTFEDVTVQSGVYSEEGKALGVALLDFNDDGWLDFVVSNDTQPDFLYQNEAGKSFREVGLISGMALDESGKAGAGMGIDVGVVDETGEETIFIGNFANEMIGVYRDLGKGAFVDRAAISKVGHRSLLYLTFGLFLFDYDYDFDLDLFATNGHVQPEIETVQQAVTFRQPSLLYENRGQARFQDVSASFGEALRKPIVGRGAAYADYDQDGDLDVLVAVNNGAPMLLRNSLLPENGASANYLRVRLVGTTSNRDAVGAKVTVALNQRILRQYVRTGGSYMSQSELVLTFGLGRQEAADRLSVEWPSGLQETFDKVGKGEVIIREGEGRVEHR